jgi:hypothetical protein
MMGKGPARFSALLCALGHALVLPGCAPGGSSDDGPLPVTPNPILFVTQVPVVADFTTIVSTFGTHSPSPSSAPRGGDLWIRYEDGELRNLTAEAGYGASDVFQGASAIAVREPCVHWSGSKAVFAMVVGAPTGGGEGSYKWQLYEVSGFGRGETALITKVPLQPAAYNNVSPVYASDGRILFTSDRPRNGAAHLYPQLDEYEEAATNTGIWSLDPTSGELFLMNHAPSGAFRPLVDAFGRVVFTRWDHLERDQQADQDRMGFGSFGTFNWSDEGPGSFHTASNAEVFPEPRKQWIDFIESNPGYSGDPAGYQPYLVGNGSNHFQLWTLNQDGTAEETLNHVGRHELFNFFERMRTDDFNVVDHVGFDPWVANRNSIGSFHQAREHPLQPGLYYGIDCREFDTHGSGQVIALTGEPTRNPNEMSVTFVTHLDTRSPTSTPSPNHSGFYRCPLPLSDGTLIAAHTANTKKEQNQGSSSMPRSRFDFRLKTLALGANGFFAASRPLTRGIHERVQYFDPFEFDTFDGFLWELDAVEVVARPAPPDTSQAALEAPERDALTAEGVTPQGLRQYLRDHELALIVSRNVTSRDRNDRQQPLNLRVPGGVETLAGGGTVYDVAHLRIFQGDLLRGLTNGIFGTQNGRRVLAQPLHEPAALNPPNAGGPSGSVAIAPDGSLAALVPARRALSWQLNAPDGTPVVNERYWVSFQAGEIRLCANCHGQNENDQAGRSRPTNSPQALRTLLQHLKASGEL